MQMGSPAPASAIRILVAEDEEDLRLLLRYNLEHAGYQVFEARDGYEADLLLKESRPDLLLLDWMLPLLSGTDVLRRLRKRPETAPLPVILLSARGEEQDLVQGFDLGADDYVVKPFSLNELLARIQALLRRKVPAKIARTLKVGDTELDCEAMSVARRGKTIHLGPTDYRLLEFFMAAPDRVHSRNHILDAIWGSETEIDDRTIDVHIGRLRKALMSSWRSDPITTVRGVGYRFDPK